MRIALLADIHANLPALKQVLKALTQHNPDFVFSLGDQVGMGPEPTEVLDLLESQHIPCLLGNHEARVLSLRAGGQASLETAVNFALARWNQRLLEGYSLDFPVRREWRTPAGILAMQHAGVDDPFMPLDPWRPQKLMHMLDADVTNAVAIAHYHDDFHIASTGKVLMAVGSIGMSHGHGGGIAQYTIVDAHPEGWMIYPHTIQYDTSPLRAAFIRKGWVQADPVMARVVHEEMLTGETVLDRFLCSMSQAAQSAGETEWTPERWQHTATSFTWTDPSLSCDAYWKS